MNETQWTKTITDDMKKCNAMVFAIVGSLMQEPGWPDRFISHSVWQGHLEFKGVKTKLEAKQAFIVRELNRRKEGTAYVIRQPDRIEDHRGSLVDHFDGTGFGLIHKLGEMNR